MWCHKIHFVHIMPNPVWRRRLPNTWVVFEREGVSRRLFFFYRETCWTSFFPCYGLATAGGEQCNQPPWENIVVRPPLMMEDWIWRHAGDSQRTKRSLPASKHFPRLPFERYKIHLKHCVSCCQRHWNIGISLSLLWGRGIVFLLGY